MPEFGLFPLGIVLLPREQIPLHVFEDRYQELIGECLEEEREFGLSSPTRTGCARSARARASPRCSTGSTTGA